MSVETLDIRIRMSRPGFELDIAQDIAAEGVTAVFGPSGSGKTTLLRAVAGFETPVAGRIALKGETWMDKARRIDLPPHRRPVGMVFQDGRLFPHLTVAGNLDFAERRRSGGTGGFSKADVIKAFDLEALLSRRPDTLSGGEEKRVALARAVLTRPRLLLLDEPLSGLDRDRKARILPYLENLPQRFGLPIFYVSHDMEEVARLADDILVLERGRLRDYGPAAQVIERLDLEPLTGAFEAGVVVEGTVTGEDRRLLLTHVDLGGDGVDMPFKEELKAGDRVRLRIRARDVALAVTRPQGISIRNILPGTVRNVVTAPGAPFAEVLVGLRSARLRARITRAALEDLALEPGSKVFALVKSVSFEGRLG